MHIKIKLKTKEQLLVLYPKLSQASTYGNIEYKIYSLRNIWGTDVTERIPHVYEDWKSVPDEIQIGSYKIPKKALTWEKNDSKISKVTNGLMRLK